jgi:hypothetical protein
VKPAGVRPHDFRHRGGKGDYIMPHLGLNLVDALHAEISALADGFSCILGHNASFRKRFSRRHFDGKPGAKAVFVVPGTAHFRAGVAWDHRITFLFMKTQPGQNLQLSLLNNRDSGF